MNIMSPISADSSLAHLIVTIQLARLHNRSDGADVAGIDKNRCANTWRVGYEILRSSHQINGSEYSPCVIGRYIERLTSVYLYPFNSSEQMRLI